jgi:hypothetical protein
MGDRQGAGAHENKMGDRGWEAGWHDAESAPRWYETDKWHPA